VTYDPKYDTGGLEPVRIEVKMKDGKRHIAEALTATGSPERPVSFDGCVDKFFGCVEYSARPMPRAHAEKVIEAVKALDKMDDIGELVKLLVW
jgi:hypothetical protein